MTLSVYAHLLDGEEQARRTRAVLEAVVGEAVRGVSTSPPDTRAENTR